MTEWQLVYIDKNTGEAVNNSHVFTMRSQVEREIAWCDREGYGYQVQQREVTKWEDVEWEGGR